MKVFVVIAVFILLYFLYHIFIKCKEIYCLHQAKMLGIKKMEIFKRDINSLNKTDVSNVSNVNETGDKI